LIGKNKNTNKKNFIYELIPSDNYEKNKKKTFSNNPEINLIDRLKIEDILKNNRIPLQEKVKNFDIQFESKIDEYKSLNRENLNFNEKFRKFYRNGELVDFEPFKNKNENIDQLQKLTEKRVFDEIISAYEKKNYKIPEITKKNLFEISPMLVNLNSLKDYYKFPERLENEIFLKDIKRMIQMKIAIDNTGKSNTKEIIEDITKEFDLKNNKINHKYILDNMRLTNDEEIKKNMKFKEYIELKAEELKKILSKNVFMNQSVIEEKNKENADPNKSIFLN